MIENKQESQAFEPPARRRSPSFFWPVILIGAGVIVLLTNLNVIPSVNLWSLWRLWPVLLILAGVDIIFGRRWPAVGAILALAAVGLVILLLVLAPTLGWEGSEGPWIGNVPIFGGDWEVQSASFSEPIGDAESATVDIDLTRFDASITALEDSSNLIEADVDYVGRMRFDVTGTRKRRVILDEISEGIPFRGIGQLWEGGRYSWSIGLSPDLPIDLTVGASSGSCEMDLSDLDLGDLTLNGSSGRITAGLPDARYGVRFEASSGAATFRVPAGAEISFELDMSSGRVELNLEDEVDLDLEMDSASSGDLIVSVPRGAAMKVSVTDSSSGSVRLPTDLKKVREGGEKDEGTWETQGFSSADYQITVNVRNMSSGDVVIRYK